MAEDRKTFWQKLRFKYRLSLVDEDSLTESWHTKMSLMRFIVYFILIFLGLIALFSVLILYTPLRKTLPGYSESIRRQLVEESIKVDSLGTDLEIQRQYLEVLRGVLAGETSKDTIQTLDSMQIILREQLLEAKSEITEDFLRQYEQKEKDYLQLFDVQQTTPVVSFFPPQTGQTVTAVLDGVIIVVDREIDNTYTLVLQHSTYVTIYKNVSKSFKAVGAHVQAGEAIGLIDKGAELSFELWQNGKKETIVESR